MNLISDINLKGDRTIWGVVFALSLFSLLVVYSTAGWAYLFKHFIKLVIGIIAMYIVHNIKFKYFSKIGQLTYFLSIALLILVLLIGVSINGASRWITIAGLQFQPSDIAKLAVLLYIARQLSIKRDVLVSFKNVVWYILLPLVIICFLILPNNFSTSALIFINGIALMFIANIKLKHICLIISLSILSILSIYFFTKYTSLGEKIIPRSITWVSRIDAYIFDNDDYNHSKDFQQIQALVAIQNGGVQGVGPGKSIQRSILPYSSSDFIFAIIIEEYGIVGGICIVLAYLILFFRAIRISLNTNSVFASLVTVGIVFSMVLQALINMLVSVGIMPVTGQTLPLISMGGTSIVFTCISIGIVLSISRDASDRNYEKI